VADRRTAVDRTAAAADGMEDKIALDFFPA